MVNIGMSDNGSKKFLHRVYRQYIGPVKDSRTVYVGFGLFFTGVGLIITSIAIFLWSTTIQPGQEFKYILREFAVFTGASGIPTLLLGTTVLLPVSRRIDFISSGGVALCLIAAVRFTQVYWEKWFLNNNSSIVVGLYALGAIIVVATAGTALSGYYVERTSRELAQQQLEANAEAEQERATEDDVSEAEVRRDIETAMEGAEINWGGVERDDTRGITLTADEDEFASVDLSNISAEESTGSSVDDAVAGLQGLKGGDTKTETGSGTTDQASALAELRTTQEQRHAEQTHSTPTLVEKILSLFGR
jgi:hypothetical protein